MSDKLISWSLDRWFVKMLSRAEVTIFAVDNSGTVLAKGAPTRCKDNMIYGDLRPVRVFHSTDIEAYHFVEDCESIMMVTKKMVDIPEKFISPNEIVSLILKITMGNS